MNRSTTADRSTNPFSAGMFAGLAQVAVALVLAGCGGEDDAGVAAIVPTWPPNAPMAQVAPVSTLQGNMICAAGSFSYQTFPDGTRRLVNVSELGAPKIDNRLSVAYRGPDEFQLDINGFGGDDFAPLDKREAVFREYWYFVKGSSEFEIGSASLANASLGRYSEGSSLCFFAVGSESTSWIPGDGVGFSGHADGISSIGGTTTRLTHDSRARGTLDFDGGQIELVLSLAGTALPLQTSGPGMPIGTVNGQLAVSATGHISGVLTGPGESRGTAMGTLFQYGYGLGLVFELVYPNGGRIYGAAAADLNRPM